MNIKNSLLLSMLFVALSVFPITMDDIQKTNVNTFFKVWSQFLDAIIAEKKFPMSNENRVLYQAFVDQAKKLNMEKLTGNKKLFFDMQKQIDGIKQRIDEQKQFSDEWNQFQGALAGVPLTPEIETTYKSFIKRAKDLHVAPELLNEMQAKMDATKSQINMMQMQVNMVSGQQPMMMPQQPHPMPEVMQPNIISAQPSGVEMQITGTPVQPSVTPVQTDMSPSQPGMMPVQPVEKETQPARPSEPINK